MRVIITGGTGLIGRALAVVLVARGDDVVVLSRDPGHATGLPPGARVVLWDGKTGQSWQELIVDDTAIVNLAGESIAGGRWTHARKRKIEASRLQAGQAVVEAVRAATTRPRVLIQASAVGFYGPRGSEAIDESAPAGNDFLARVCVAWERSTSDVESLGVRRVIIRTGVVLAPNGGALPPMLLPFRMFIGGPLGNGKQPLSWIHLDDEVGAITFLLETDAASGPFNLAGPRPIDNAEFSRIIGRILGRPAFLPAPGFALHAILGEMSTMVLEGQRAVPFRLQAAGYEFKFADAESALAAILRPAIP